MSRSNASAIQRRTAQPQIKSAPQIQPEPEPQTQLKPKMTMQQVVILLDQRVNELEKSKNEVNNTVSVNDLNGIISEFNNRFEILAKEIDDIKNMLMKLQSYTMDVNKMLVDERIQILSNIDDLDQPTLKVTDETIEVTNDIEIIGDVEKSEINSDEITVDIKKTEINSDEITD